MKTKMKSLYLTLACSAAFATLAGCQATGEQYAANTYTAGQVNSRQEAKTVEILAVLPAKIQVDNAQGKQAAQIAGGLLGALAGGAAAGGLTHGNPAKGAVLGAAGGAAAGAAMGSLVPDQTLVEGVSLSYKDNGKVFNSAQVGKACQFKPGTAVMVSTSATETRIQPNAECPTQAASK